MKKILMVFAIVTLISSCKKDRVCTCTAETGFRQYGANAPTTTKITTYKDVTKNTMKNNCVSTESDSAGYVVSTRCSFK